MSLVDPQTDMAFGQGTAFPCPIAKKYGVVVCGGTFFIRSNQKTKRFFTNVVMRCEECGDDQTALNETLFSGNSTAAGKATIWQIALNKILFADKPDVTPPKHERKYREIRESETAGVIEFSWDDKPLLVIGQDGNTIAKVWSMNTVSRLPRLPYNGVVVWHSPLSLNHRLHLNAS